MTNGMEDRLRAAFAEVAEEVRPHHNAFTENRERLRRQRKRQLIAIPSLAVTTAAAVTAAVVALPSVTHGQEGTAQQDTGATQGITRMVAPSTLVTISGRAGTSGARFRIDAVSPDGGVVGRTPDNALWSSGPHGGKPVSVGLKAEGGVSLDNGILTYQEPGSRELKCRTASGKTFTVNPQEVGGGTTAWTAGGMIVGVDIMLQPFVDTSCSPGVGGYPPGSSSGSDKCPGGGCTPLKGPYVSAQFGAGYVGQAVAVNSSTLFLSEPSNNKVIYELDLRTARVVRQHPLPPGVLVHTMDQQDQRWWAAANAQSFGWVAGGVLRVTDLATWAHTVTPLPKAKIQPGVRNVVTAGDHVFVYSALSASGKGESLVYDTQTRQVVRLHGDAYAAGKWLVWRDGTDYREAQVP